MSQPSSHHSVVSVRPPRIRRAGNAVVVSLVGEVGTGSADALLCQLTADLGWRPAVVVVDLTQARFGPGSRAALRRMHGQVTAGGARFGVATPSSLARQLPAIRQRFVGTQVAPLSPQTVVKEVS